MKALDDHQALIFLAISLGIESPVARRLVHKGEYSKPANLANIDPEARARIGALGEEFVKAACEAELTDLGRDDLGKQVARVSLISDGFGYDISAPNIRGELRLLEIKTQCVPSSSQFRLYISRNEYEVGRTEANWALVCCDMAGASDGDISIAGWCRGETLGPYLPEDHNGRWTEAMVVLPRGVLLPGFPSAIP
ncbi:protein NO VEIN domain-containing protein [Nonomuraea endophytica]